MVRDCTFFILGFSLCLNACKKDDFPALIAEYWGEASALRNGEKWKPFVTAVSLGDDDSLFSIFFDTYNDREWKERLSLSKITEKPGRYPLYWAHIPESDTTEALYATLLDGDALGDIYNPDNQAASFVKITEYHPESKEIKGLFEVTLVLTMEDGHGPRPPDTVRFTEGRFHTKIRKSLD